MDLEKGGRGAIERMVEAYGFTTRQALCDQLGVSKGTLANRYMRDSFPADWIIRCSLETGASLQWLTTGDGPIYEDAKTDVIALSKKKLMDGILLDSSFLMFDKAFLPDGLKRPEVVIDGNNTYIVENDFGEVVDGRWLVAIEGTKSIRDIVRIPIGRVKVSGGEIVFDCEISDIKILSKVIMKCSMQF